MVGAGADGADHLVRFGGREDEHHMLGRLLHDFEQRVESLRRDHVRLVKDEDLVLITGRRESGTLAQFTRVVHTVVRGRVDFDHVDGPGATGGEILAGFAFAAGVGCRAFRTVDAAGENTRGACLAASSRAREQVGVRQLAFVQGPHQRHGNLFLPDDAFERIRTITTVKGQRHNSQHLPVLASAHRVHTRHLTAFAFQHRVVVARRCICNIPTVLITPH